MSWNQSQKHLKVKCPECGDKNVRVNSSEYEWVCDACTSTGPSLHDTEWWHRY